MYIKPLNFSHRWFLGFNFWLFETFKTEIIRALSIFLTKILGYQAKGTTKKKRSFCRDSRNRPGQSKSTPQGQAISWSRHRGLRSEKQRSVSTLILDIDPDQAAFVFIFFLEIDRCSRHRPLT